MIAQRLAEGREARGGEGARPEDQLDPGDVVPRRAGDRGAEIQRVADGPDEVVGPAEAGGTQRAQRRCRGVQGAGDRRQGLAQRPRRRADLGDLGQRGQLAADALQGEDALVGLQVEAGVLHEGDRGPQLAVGEIALDGPGTDDAGAVVAQVAEQVVARLGPRPDHGERGQDQQAHPQDQPRPADDVVGDARPEAGQRGLLQGLDLRVGPGDVVRRLGTARRPPRGASAAAPAPGSARPAARRPGSGRWPGRCSGSWRRSRTRASPGRRSPSRRWPPGPRRPGGWPRSARPRPSGRGPAPRGSGRSGTGSSRSRPRTGRRSRTRW